MEKLVSIIVPVYNNEGHLSHCVTSLICQTYQALEIILVDDGSTDSSLCLCEEWAEKDGRITVYHQENRGVSAARNVGLSHVRGEYVLFVDSDDSLVATCVEQVVKEADTGVDCVVFGHQQVDTAGNVLLEERYKQQSRSIEEMRGDIWQYRQQLSYTWAKCYKTAVIQDNHLQFDEHMSYCEDTLFVVQYAKHCQCVQFSEQVGYLYLRHPDQTISKYIPNHFAQALLVHRAIQALSTTKEQPMGHEEASLLCGLFFNAVLNLFFKQLPMRFRTAQIKAYLQEPDIQKALQKIERKRGTTLYQKAQNVFLCFAKTKNVPLLYSTVKFFVFLRRNLAKKA